MSAFYVLLALDHCVSLCFAIWMFKVMSVKVYDTSILIEGAVGLCNCCLILTVARD